MGPTEEVYPMEDTGAGIYKRRIMSTKIAIQGKVAGLPMLLVLLVLAAGCTANRTVRDDLALRFDSQRRDLTVAYLRDRYGLDTDSPEIRPQMVVLHWTAIPDLNESHAAFAPGRLPNTRPDIRDAGALNVSAHYLVDRDGTVYRLLPDTVMARHVIGLNHCAIGIENVGGTPETPLTRAQLKANIRLVRELAGRHPIRYLIGHSEYTRFQNHSLWLERDSTYRTEKTDPGISFMQSVRRAVRDLDLQGPPQTPNP